MILEKDLLSEGAKNLLINCADLNANERLVIISEDPSLGWYDPEITQVLRSTAESMGVATTLLPVGGPENSRGIGISKAIEDHDCILFLSRIGDQGRFDDPIPGKKLVMSYARDAPTLASVYGRSHHHAFLDLKEAVNEIMLSSNHVRITCPDGTDLSGSVANTQAEILSDVSVRRFPMGVPQPFDASQMSGQVALTRYLTPTGSRVYEPDFITINDTVFADIEEGRITELRGNKHDVKNIREHHDRVADRFFLDANVVHSFHAGIHPGSEYRYKAGDNPDRWSNSVFTNPRVLHFHTCGIEAPAEICWMLIDHTLTVDGADLWRDGKLLPENHPLTKNCVKNWPELSSFFETPSQEIGL